MNREIKIRVWISAEKRWMNALEYPKFVSTTQCNALDINIDNGCSSDTAFYIISQYTGLKDKNGKEIYEGDIVKFKYHVGDLAWEFMHDEEIKRNEEMIDKTFVGVIAHRINEPVNLEIVCGKSPSPQIFFPLTYASSGIVIGNIFENPELLA